ncbi:putative pectin lyase C [Colletotrichum sp. SAR 10_99]|nr:putative pectin lyase C [Colletotrichum sp. SAR 10_99]
MKSAPTLLAVLAGLANLVAAQTVSGKPEGFATGVTGGGSATAVTPADITELKEYLTDDEPRVILLSKEYDFTESEGTESGNVCASWGTGAACQKIIQDDCGSNPASTETWYKAPTQPIDVGNNKTILGVGSKGAIKGKGLRMRGSNVIQKHPKHSGLRLEPQTARPGRQHYVFGFNPSKRITLSNNFINGESDYSTGCNGYHYWTFEMVGTDDQITMKNNYIYKTSGRSPALSGGTLLHAVNNVWDDNDGHALEGGDTKARGIFEGNAFINVKALVSDYQGKLFSSPDATTNAECKTALGRACEVNVFDTTTSTDFSKLKDTSFFSEFSGFSIASAESASSIKTSVPNNAGAGKLSSSSSSSGSTKSADAVAEAAATTPAATSAAAPAAAATSAAASSGSGSGSVALYGQCGGQGYSGATSCASGKCEVVNDWYSQCV